MKRVLWAFCILALSCSSRTRPVEGDPVPVEGEDPSIDLYSIESGPEGGGKRSSRIECAAASRFARRRDPRRDLEMECSFRRVSLRARRRVRKDGERMVFHAGVEPSDGIVLMLGDLLLDTGIGLLSSARRFDYPFSSRYPLASPSGLRGWTGMYGRFLRGEAVRIESGPLRLSAFEGVRARHGGDDIRFEEGRSRGLQAVVAGGEGSVSMAMIDEGTGRLGLSARSESNGIALCLETVVAIPGDRTDAAAAAGLRKDFGRTGIGALFYRIPSGAAGFFSEIPGAGSSPVPDRQGCTLVLSLRGPGRTRVSVSMTGNREDEGGKTRRETDLRLRAEYGGGPRIALSARDRSAWSLEGSPGPPVGADRLRRRDLRLTIHTGSRPGLSTRTELAMQVSREDAGLMAGASAGFATAGGRAVLSSSGAVFRPIAGRPRFSFYEPSVSGSFPWKTVYGRGSRLGLSAEFRAGPFVVSLSVRRDSRAGIEGDMRLEFDYEL